MTLGLKGKVFKDEDEQQQRSVAPQIPDRVHLRHQETGEVSSHWPIDGREILAQPYTLYEPADDEARQLLGISRPRKDQDDVGSQSSA